MIGLAVAAPLLLGLHFVAWLINAAPGHRLAGAWLGVALGSEVGRIELARIALAALALWALGLARRVRLAFGFAAAAVLVSGATGHSAAIHPVWAIPAKALHLAAVAAWLGGLLWLAARQRDRTASLLRNAACVSSVALAAVAVVAISGVVQTLLFLPSPLDLFRSAYGATVLLKLAGLAVLVGFGAHHRFRVLPRLEQAVPAPGFRASLRWEIAAMVAVLLLGGFLAYVPPPAPPGGHALSSHGS